MKKMLFAAVVAIVLVQVTPAFAFPIQSQSFSEPWKGESCFWGISGEDVELIVVSVNPHFFEGEADLSVSFDDTRFLPVTLDAPGRYVLELPRTYEASEVCVKVYSDEVWVDRASLDDGRFEYRDTDVVLELVDLSELSKATIGGISANPTPPPSKIQPPVWLIVPELGQ
jgi:hypothetical protein